MLLAGCTSVGAGSTAQSGKKQITIRTDKVVAAFDRRLLGTNVPAWLLPQLVADQTFRALTVASGTTMLRLPGGSWSSDYDWLGCERGDPNACKWAWAMRPSDFIGLLESTRLPAMWTVSFNGTAQEAAAAVAFFNGSVEDDRPIGEDRNGRDWMTVGHWAQLRVQDGHPDPVPIHYWEVGNEVYGAVRSAGPHCASWGWENVWTCDPTEYVRGNDQHDGFLQFRDEMRAVDPDIEVGAVGVGDKGAWSDWDDTVMKEAGDDIDFYVVHHYGSNGDPSASKVLALPRKQWPDITKSIRASAADGGLGSIPIAVTEHNLVAFIDGDPKQLMTTALNAFYLSDTIGQMATNSVTIANQWNLANGVAANGSDYGLFDAQTHHRSPAYYALALWSRFGDEVVRVDSGSGLRKLTLYGGRSADGSTQLLVMNPSSAPIDATIAVAPAVSPNTSVTADVVQMDSLRAHDVTFNGSAAPSTGLTEPSEVLSLTASGELNHEFPGFSITLLRWSTTA
jgi:hypothetical protein